jgi:hypothetical protein
MARFVSFKINIAKPNYILDEYQAYIGLSLRQLKATATRAVRVRRTSDNTETDIGFVKGDFDTATFSSFIGVSEGRIVTLYDQSGAGRNATQNSQALQPRIDLNIKNGKPAIFWNGGQVLSYAGVNFLSGLNPSFSIITTFSTTNISTVNDLFTGSESQFLPGGAGGVYYGQRINTDGSFRIYKRFNGSSDKNVTSAVSQIAINNWYINENYSNAGTIQNYLNNTQIITNGDLTGANSTYNLIDIGCLRANGVTGGTAFYKGYSADIIGLDTYDEVNAGENIKNSTNSYYNIF